MNILEIEQLSIGTYSRGKFRKLVTNLGLAVQQGEILGLAGPNGAGKSLTASAVSGALPSGVQIISGSIKLCGNKLKPGKKKDWNGKRGVQILPIFQSASQALNPTLRVKTQLTESLRNIKGLSRKESINRAIQLVHNVGLEKEHLSAYPFELSGGMRQRILIALAYGLKPNLVVADEPTTGLDPVTQKRILDLMLRLRDKHESSFLFISHDLQAVCYMADKIAIMSSQGIVESQTPLELWKRPQTYIGRSMVQAFGTLLEKET